MTETCKPRFVLRDDYEYGDGLEAFFAATLRWANAEDERAEERARSRKPPPEESRPLRRRSPLADERPRWSGKPKPERPPETPT